MTQNQAHYAKLIQAMDNEPQMWQFSGVVRDLKAECGACACGHLIRYEFVLCRKDNPAKTIVVGSSCVFSAPFIPADLVAAIKAYIARKQEEARQAEEARRVVFKDKLASDFIKNKEECFRIYQSRYDIVQNMFPERRTYGTSDYEQSYKFLNSLYVLCKKVSNVSKKKLKTSRGWIKTYQEITQQMVDFNNSFKTCMVLFSSSNLTEENFVAPR